MNDYEESAAADFDDTHDNEVSHAAYTSLDTASAVRLSIPDHLDHICEEVNYLHSRLSNMESSMVQSVSNEIKSSLPAMITNALKEQLPGILSATLKDYLPLIINESLQTHNPTIFEQFAETQAQLNKKMFSLSFQDMQTQLQDVKDLLKLAIIIDETTEGEKNTNAILAPTQGEHKTAKNITHPEPSPETQGELAYKESTLLVSKTKVNEESAMVLYNHEKDLVDLTTTEQDSDDDDLDK
ncbi:hypothetical protein Tco_0374004 [Tanacetum coccineum]